MSFDSDPISMEACHVVALLVDAGLVELVELLARDHYGPFHQDCRVSWVLRHAIDDQIKDTK